MRFVRKLEDVCHRLGEPLRLECSYAGSQRVYVAWRKDDKPIWASYLYNVKTSGSSCVLEVLNGDRDAAAGKYSCEISNAEETVSCHAHVKIGNALTNASPASTLTLTLTGPDYSPSPPEETQPGALPARWQQGVPGCDQLVLCVEFEKSLLKRLWSP